MVSISGNLQILTGFLAVVYTGMRTGRGQSDLEIVGGVWARTEGRGKRFPSPGNRV